MRSRKDMTTSDLEYIAKFYKFDGAHRIGAALDMAAQDIRNVYSQMNVSGQLNTLRKLEACYVGVR